MTEYHYTNLPNAPVAEADVLILPVPLEQTVSYKPGAGRAAYSVLEVSDQVEYYEDDVGWCPTKHMKVCVLPGFEPEDQLTGIDYQNRLYDHVAALPGDNLFIAIGGEHAVTPALVRARLPEPGWILHLDAHADLRAKFHGDPWSHATPIHHLLGYGHRVVQCGIRSFFEGEAVRIANDPMITCYRDRELQKPKVWQQLMDDIASFSGPGYLTIDMDGFDPALVPGVGTPQPGGLSWFQGLDIIEALFANPNIDLRGMDIVELAHDVHHVSEMTAAKLLQKAMSFWGRSKGYPNRPETGSQMSVDYD
ncbi:MAG: agmatinase [Gammaproteobacteria bacterium]|nr:agmatinase [Gammaproteobacteria bacterium]